jgi:hypothetical protein
MKIRVKETKEVIGEVITNQSLDIFQACELAGINIDDCDVEAELYMDYEA